jgi:hypothetical protein
MVRVKHRGPGCGYPGPRHVLVGAMKRLAELFILAICLVILVGFLYAGSYSVGHAVTRILGSVGGEQND